MGILWQLRAMGARWGFSVNWRDLRDADINLLEGICYIVIFTSIMSLWVMVS